MSLVNAGESIRDSGAWEPGVNLLILVDQFEELFRFRVRQESAMADRDEKASFVKLLLEAAKQKTLPIFVVITMRSDFLGDCAQFRNLPEAINEGQYLIPQMTREERRSAIESPVHVTGGDIAPALVQRILNDTGEDPGQLPVMQHALMRTWNRWRDHRRPGKVIDVEDYEAIGTLAKALSSHADEAFHEACRLLPGRGEEIVKRIFQRLRDQDVSSREIRRPTALAELCAVAESSREEMLLALECFRRERRSFLMPPPLVTLTDDSQIDITHECLLRQWERLVDWVADELESLRIYQRLAYRAEEQQASSSDFMKGAPLQLALDWWERRRPSQAWAERYHGDFALTEGFLRASREQREIERRRDEQARREEEERRIEEMRKEQAQLETLRSAQAHAQAEQQRAESAQTLAAAEQKARLRQRWFTLGLLVLVLFLVAAAAAVFWQSRVAQSRELAITALSQLEKDPELSLLLAIEAQKKWLTPEADQVLKQALAGSNIRVRLAGHEGPLTAASYSPDGSLVVTSAAGAARIWDAATGIERHRLEGHSEPVTYAGFSPDGARVVTTSSDSTARIYDTATGALTAELRGHSAAVNRAAFSPDGSRLVTASADRTAMVWETATGTMLYVLRGQSDELYNAVFSADGSRVVTASVQTAGVWRLPPSKPRIIEAGVGGTVAIAGDGSRIISISANGNAQVLDVMTGRQISSLRGLPTGVGSAAFSADGSRVVIASGDGASVWETSTGKLSIELHGHQGVVISAAFSADGLRVVTASNDQTARVWDTTSGKILSEPRGHTGRVTIAAVSPDGRHVLTASDDQTARIWQFNELELTAAPLLKFKAEAAAVSVDGARVMVIDSESKSAVVWDSTAGQVISTLGGEIDWSGTSGKFSPDGSRLGTTSADNKARIWEVSTGSLISELSESVGSLTSSAFNFDNSYLITEGMDPSAPARIWDVSTGNVIRKLEGHKDWVSSTVFSPDGTLVATASLDGTARIWEVATGKLLSELLGHNASVTGVAFNFDGSRLATASDDRTARIWNPLTGDPISTLRGHAASVTSVAFSPDGLLLVTASDDGTAGIWLWKAPGINLARVIWSDPGRRDLDRIAAAAFNSAGQVSLVSDAGSHLTYDCEVCGDQPLTLASMRVTRELTRDERAQYLHLSSAP